MGRHPQGSSWHLFTRNSGIELQVNTIRVFTDFTKNVALDTHLKDLTLQNFQRLLLHHTVIYTSPTHPR